MITLGSGTLGSGTLGAAASAVYAQQNTGVLLLVELYFDGGYHLQRVATDWWYSLPTDSIGVQEWQDRVISEPTYSVQLGCVAWASRTSVSVGSIEVADPAGELDWMTRKTRDSLCVLRLARHGQSYDETRIVGRAIVDAVEMTGVTKVVKLRGIDTLLDRPLQTTLYAAGSVSTSTSSEGDATDVPPANAAGGNPTIEGQRIPVVLGRVYQHEPVLVDTASLAYQVTDAGIVGIDAVLSGGSVANPPDSSDEDWDYSNLRTGFRMAVSPSARITCHADGIRALTAPVVSDRFASDAAWSSDGLAAWTVTTSTSGQAVDRVQDVGVLMTADAGESGGPSIVRALAASEGDWVVVLVEVPDLRDGSLAVSVGSDPVAIKRDGRHALIFPIGASSELTIASVPDASGADATIASVYVYELQASTGTESLVEMMRHITIARGALPDADVTRVPAIGASSGDFDTSSDLDGVQIDTTNATVSASGGVLDFVVGDSVSAGSVFMRWPQQLSAGERYELMADVNITLRTGPGLPSGGMIFRFIPDDFDSAAFITIDQFDAVGSHSASRIFAPSKPGRLYIVAAVQAGGQLEFTADNLRVSMLEYGDDGATVDFDSLADVDPGYTFGIATDEATTVRDIASRLLDSICGWMYPDSEGRIRFGRLAEPDGPSVLSISAVNLVSLPVFTPDNAPGLSDTIAGARNWSPYSEQELAGITYPNRPPFRADYRAKRRGASAESLARPYTHAIGADVIETLIYDEASVSAEADRLTGIYTDQRGFWTAEVALDSASEASELRPDMTVTLDDPLFGDDNGKRCRIVGVDGRYRSQVVTLTLWGATSG